MIQSGYEEKNGGGGIRTPGALITLNGFQDRRLQPLGHSSMNQTGYTTRSELFPGFCYVFAQGSLQPFMHAEQIDGESEKV